MVAFLWLPKVLYHPAASVLDCLERSVLIMPLEWLLLIVSLSCMHRCLCFCAVFPASLYFCTSVLGIAACCCCWCGFIELRLAPAVGQLPSISPPTRRSGVVCLDFRDAQSGLLSCIPNSPDATRVRSFSHDGWELAAAGVCRGHGQRVLGLGLSLGYAHWSLKKALMWPTHHFQWNCGGLRCLCLVCN